MATIKIVEFNRIYEKSTFVSLKELVCLLTEDPGGIFFRTCDGKNIENFTWKEEDGSIVLGNGGITVITRDDAEMISLKNENYNDPKNMGRVSG